jgi:hypothetical protein
MRTALLWTLSVGLLTWPGFGCRDADPPDPASQPSAALGSGHAVARGPAARTRPLVASVGREIYHRPTCRWAAKIDERALIGYDTPAQAAADGRRPCKVCKPEKPEKPEGSAKP